MRGVQDCKWCVSVKKLKEWGVYTCGERVCEVCVCVCVCGVVCAREVGRELTQ